MRHAPSVLSLVDADVVRETAPWCARLENIELGLLLLALPWVADGGLRRADLERRLGLLGRELPLGPIYFQRVRRAVARLESIDAMIGLGQGRSRRFSTTPKGLAALLLNLGTVTSDPTLDGGEFELKRALVGMFNLVLEQLDSLPEGLVVELGTGRDGESFFDELEALEILGRKVVTDEVISRSLDVLGLLETQRAQIASRLRAAEARYEALSATAERLEGVDLGRLLAGLVPSAAAELDSTATELVRSLAGGKLPRTTLRATVLRYRAYLGYLDELAELYAGQLTVVDLSGLRRLAARRSARARP